MDEKLEVKNTGLLLSSKQDEGFNVSFVAPVADCQPAECLNKYIIKKI